MLIVDKPFENGLILSVKETRIDMSISRKFREQVSKLLEKKPQIVVFDLAETEYLDSSALGALVTILRDVKGYGGEIRLANLNQTLKTLFKLSKLESMFKIFDTVEEATR
ncbi:MAG: STAS domain-containing protein [Turneriella sp.]|nr:STAS domain-containing protein [Turneriella sp.]